MISIHLYAFISCTIARKLKRIRIKKGAPAEREDSSIVAEGE